MLGVEMEDYFVLEASAKAEERMKRLDSTTIVPDNISVIVPFPVKTVPQGEVEAIQTLSNAS